MAATNHNIIFTALEVSKLIESARTGNKADIRTAVASLKEKCLKGPAVVAVTCTHALTSFVELGFLDIANGMSTLISLMTAEQRVAGLVPAVGRLLILQASQPEFQDPYNISDRPHPFVTMLRHDWGFWDEIFAFIREYAIRNWLAVRAVISHVFLNPKTPRANKTQLVNFLAEIDKSDDIFWELFSWQIIDVDWCWLLQEKLLTGKLKQSEKLSQELAIATSVWLSRQGFDSSLWLREGTFSQKNIFLLAKYMPELATSYVNKFSKSGCEDFLKTSSFSKSGLTCLIAALLQWTLFPSNLTSHSASFCKEILKMVPKLSEEGESDEREYIIQSNPDLILSHDISRLVEEFEEITGSECKTSLQIWLNSLTRSKFAVKHLHFLLLGYLLHETDETTIKLILTTFEGNLKVDSSLANSLLAVVLHKLSVEKNPSLQWALLNFLPNLAIQKENIPLILGTIESLQGGQNNIFVSIRLKLLLKLWLIQPRTFSYLHRQLISACKMAQHFDDIQLACASCLLEICQHSPDQHGREVVNLLSEILNSATDEGGAEAAAMAIRAIVCLCKHDVVDFQSSWQAIGPKMRHEKRPIVAAAVCELLGESSSDDVIAREPIDRLWKFVQDDCAAEAALRTLGKFSVESIPLASLPVNYRQGLTIPKDLAGGDELPPEQVLTYVPGVCWVQLLEKSSPRVSGGVDDLVRGLLKKEIALFPRGLYSLPLGGTEPVSLSHLPPNSILRALVDCLRGAVSKGAPSRLCLRILKILSEDYNRPLPPLDWSFLRLWLADLSARGYLLTLCARQGPKSQSAITLLDEYFNCLQHDVSLATFLKEDDTVMNNLANLCQCLSGDIITSIISELLTHSDTGKLQRVVRAVRATIGLGVVPEKNRIALAKALIDILTEIDLDFKDDPLENLLWETISELPDKILVKVTCPAEWATVTARRIKIACKVCGARALLSHGEDKKCVSDFGDLLDRCLVLEDETQSFVIKEMILLLRATKNENCRLLFICLLDTLRQASNKLQDCLFFLELLVSATAVLSGYDVMCVDYRTKDLYSKLSYFPQSLYHMFIEASEEWPQHAAPHVIEGLYRLSRCETLPESYRDVMTRGLRALRSHNYYHNSGPAPRWPRLFYTPLPLPKP